MHLIQRMKTGRGALPAMAAGLCVLGLLSGVPSGSAVYVEEAEAIVADEEDAPDSSAQPEAADQKEDTAEKVDPANVDGLFEVVSEKSDSAGKAEEDSKKKKKDEKKLIVGYVQVGAQASIHFEMGEKPSLEQIRQHPFPTAYHGMEIVEVAGERSHADQIVAHGHGGELLDPRIGGAGVQGIGGVGHDGQHVPLPQQRHEGRSILLVQGLRLAAPRVAKKELEGVGLDAQCVLAHAQQPLGGGKMAADPYHRVLLEKMGRCPKGGDPYPFYFCSSGSRASK